MQKSIYIILSSTQTKFARMIRFLGRQQYSHVSICLDGSFTHVYAFARPQHNAIFLSRLVEESLVRFTLSRKDKIPIAVFKIDVTNEEYEWIKETIHTMLDNPEYKYNLYSVLLFPIMKGFAVKKTFTCVEFVTYLLQHSGYLQSKKRYRYTPDDLAIELKNYLLCQKDVRDCLPECHDAENYFAPFTMRLFWLSTKELCNVTMRTVFRRGE